MIKCLASIAFYHFFPTHLINSIKHEHSCKILYIYISYVININIEQHISELVLKEGRSGADPGFLKRGFICIKVWGFSLLILSNFS